MNFRFSLMVLALLPPSEESLYCRIVHENIGNIAAQVHFLVVMSIVLSCMPELL